MGKKYYITSHTGSTQEINVEEGVFMGNDGKELEIVKHKGDVFTVKVGEETLKAELIWADYATKSFVVLVNNHRYKLKAANDFDLLLQKMGMGAEDASKIKNLKAPMPGMILNVLVAVGDTVNKGDNLLLLEAMKMENNIKSAGTGVIKQILAQKGKAVEKNQILIEFE